MRMNLAKTTLDKMLDTGKPVKELVSESDLAGVDENQLRKICEQVVKDNPNAVADYRAGKVKAVKALIGGVMKATRGKADATQAEALLIEMING